MMLNTAIEHYAHEIRIALQDAGMVHSDVDWPKEIDRWPAEAERIIAEHIRLAIEVAVGDAVRDFAKADDAKKLLDSGWNVFLFRDDFGSYTAVAVKDGEALADVVKNDRRIVDDFTPSEALYRLTEKVTTGRIA